LSKTIKTSAPVKKVKLIADPKEFIPLFKQTVENDLKLTEEKKFKDAVSQEVKRVINVAVNREVEKVKKEYELKFPEKYEEGKKKGIEIGHKELKERVELAIDTLKSIIRDAEDKRKNIINSAEKDVLEIASYLAEKVILRKIEIEENIVLDVVKEALDHVSGETKVILKLNPDDVKMVESVKEDILSQFEMLDKMDLIPDKSVTKGGCIIETESGIIDSDIKSRFEAVRKELLKDFDGKK